MESTVNYMVATHACFPHDLPLGHTATPALAQILSWVTVAALVICIAGGATAYASWRRTRDEMSASTRDAAEVREGRTRFLALSGIFVSALFFLAVLFDIPGLFLTPCG